MSRHQFTSRTKARKRAADVVFEADQRGMGEDPQVLTDLLRERRVLTAALTPLPEYSATIVAGVARNLRRIDDLISAHAKVAGLDRIPAVDLAVLRVAVWELLENADDVPPLVAIDEAVSIVKSISTDTSPGFVNAVLDAVRKEIGAPAWQRGRVLRDTPDEGGADAPEGGQGAVTTPPEAGVPADGTVPAAAPVDDGAVEAADAAHSEDDTDRGRPTAARDGHPTLEDIAGADLEELDELLDEY